MIVYRFERRTRVKGDWLGPFIHALGGRPVYLYSDATSPYARNPLDMPNPWLEPSETPCHQKAKNYEDLLTYHCGFSSKRQMLRWFGSARGRVAMDPVCPLWAFEVPEDQVFPGEHQVLFLRSAAKRLHRLDPVTLKPVKAAT